MKRQLLYPSRVKGKWEGNQYLLSLCYIYTQREQPFEEGIFIYIL